MHELGVSKFHRTGNSQFDVLAVELERAQYAANEAVLRAERANIEVDRLNAEMHRHGQRTIGLLVMVMILIILAGVGALWVNGMFG